jgi:predicted cobalt transporter CbtA
VGPFRRGADRDGGGGWRDAGGDALAVIIAYVKQETLEPVKGLGRFVLFGVVGSLLLSVGLLLLLVALLRALQTETGTALSGNLSWVPYGCVAVVALALMGLAVWRVARGPAARQRPGGKDGSK